MKCIIELHTHITFIDRYESAPEQISQARRHASLPRTAHNVVASASAASFDTRRPSPGRKLTVISMTKSERIGLAPSPWDSEAGGARPAKGSVETSHLSPG
eukprot:6214462-Pleurochrysis_carterae.AAC.7